MLLNISPCCFNKPLELAALRVNSNLSSYMKLTQSAQSEREEKNNCIEILDRFHVRSI